MFTLYQRTYFSLRLRSLRNRIVGQSWRRWIEISVSVLILAGVEWGAYQLFFSAFKFLSEQGEIGAIMLNRTFSMGWSLIFLLLVLSNIITAFSTFYRSPEIPFLLTTKLSYSDIFKLKFIDNLIFSSWSIVLLGIPLILAYGAIINLSGLAITALSTFGLVALMWIAGTTALVITVVLVRISVFIRLRTSFILLCLGLIGVIMLYRQFNQAEAVVASDMANIRYLGRYVTNLSRIPFPMLPSFWFTNLFKLILESDIKGVYLFAGMLASTTLVMREFLIWLVGKIYYPSWQIIQSQGRVISGSQQASSRLFSGRGFLDNRMRALFVKDMVQFFRTPQQWIQFLLYILMIIVYITNLNRIQYTLGSTNEFWNRLVFIMNFGFSGFILASLITRFVFPLLSLEGKNRWILMSSPVSVGQLLRQKFWLSVILFFILAELVAFSSGILLKQTLSLIILSSFMLFLMSLTLTSISLGLGAIFPVYHETNPMRIVSGLGGIIAILASIAYLGIMTMGMIWLLNFRHYGLMSVSFASVLTVIVIINGIITYLPLRLGYRSLLNSFH